MSRQSPSGHFASPRLLDACSPSNKVKSLHVETPVSPLPAEAVDPEPRLWWRNEL